jgi:hypothetical protein
MAAAGYLSTPRGAVSQYVYSRDQCTTEHPDYVHNSESSALDGTDGLSGVIQSTLNAYYAAAGWVVSNKVLTYNPKTDVWDIKPGEYVL